jgi:hypothetical protein
MIAVGHQYIGTKFHSQNAPETAPAASKNLPNNTDPEKSLSADAPIDHVIPTILLSQYKGDLFRPVRGNRNLGDYFDAAILEV